MKNLNHDLMETKNNQTQNLGEKKMKAKKLVLGLVVLSILSLAASVSAGVPQMINYQGVLTDPDGCPVNGDYSMGFSIWNDPDVGDSLWGERHSSISVTQGNFNVLLGSINSIPGSLFLNNSLWLQVEVNDTAMAPRQRIASVGYAFRSEFADTADYARTCNGGVDNDWTFRITDGADTTLMSGGPWGLARYGNVLYGNADSTHVNLGLACTTGVSGQNYKYCTVGGGYSNIASEELATVAGGAGNTASEGYATVGGGVGNTASGNQATIAGGGTNLATSAYATVGGGHVNTAGGDFATVGGGEGNTASGDFATIGGGSGNTGSENYANVGGGYSNTASGEYATVPGGKLNLASGDYSFAAGRKAKANHIGTFVWADSTDEDFASTGDNQFLIRASGGVGIGTNTPGEELDVAGTVQMEGFIMPTDANSGYVLTSDASGVGTWEQAPSGIGGSGDSNYIAKFTGTTTIGNSGIYENGGNVGIGTTSPAQKLHIAGTPYPQIRIENTDVGGKIFELGVSADPAGGFGISDISKGSQPFFIESGASDNLVHLKGYGVGIGTSDPGTAKLAVIGGDVGIGTTDPSCDLDVNEDLRVRDDLDVDDDATINDRLIVAPEGTGVPVGPDLYVRDDAMIDGDLTVSGTIKLTFDYSSGWVYINPAQAITFYHNLGGDESKYIVDLYGKNSNDRIHQADFGTACYGLPEKCVGCEWYNLTNTQITVYRAPDDAVMSPNKDWDKCRIRILKNQ